MKIIDVFVAYGKIGSIVGISKNKSIAEYLAKDKSCWGGPVSVSQRKAIETELNRVYLIDSETPNPSVLDDAKIQEDIKKFALSKLSNEEKSVLGLK